MDLIIRCDGRVSCIYSETLELSELGRVSIRRASHVEPTDDGQWTADLAPVGGPLLGPFSARSSALAAEVEWLQANLVGSFPAVSLQ